jgi:hypothetical protein
MAPQVGLEPYPEIPTAESILRNFPRKTRKTNVYAASECDLHVPQQTYKSLKPLIGSTKAVHFSSVSRPKSTGFLE